MADHDSLPDAPLPEALGRYQPIDTVVVANRGEIAVRIARSARARGHRVVMLFTPADRGAVHCRAGDLALEIPDYLDAAEIVAMADGLDGVVAVHPGYGFLAENAGFARMCGEAGLVWVGPPPDAIAAMGDKAAARQRVSAVGVPVAPGYDGDAQDLDTLTAHAARIGFPLLVKAAAGGGGKGMRVVRAPGELADAVAEARRLAKSAFGDDRLVLEAFIQPARHVEVQILADAYGNVIHLWERDCSIQRRHQKVIEEAPAVVEQATREGLHRDGVRVAQLVGYVGAGTVEFLVGPDGQHHFLEMNTRLQVEHPVTEAITGLDLVELQLHVAEFRGLPLRQQDVPLRGHAMEARLYAEDPANGWLPAPGTISRWRVPADVRVDAGVEAGSVVGTAYDPMLAKVVAFGGERRQARLRLRNALSRLVALGTTTNRGALIEMLDDPRMVEGNVSTAFLDGWKGEAQGAGVIEYAAVVAAEHDARRAARALPEVPAGWRNNPWRDAEITLRRNGQDQAVRFRWRELSRGRLQVYLAPRDEAVPGPMPADPWDVHFHWRGDDLWVDALGFARLVSLVRTEAGWWVAHERGDVFIEVVPDFVVPGSAPAPGSLTAPMTGTVVSVPVRPGQVVAEGEVLVVIEAMKMEQTVRAPHAGTVTEVLVAQGGAVEAGVALVVLEEATGGEGDAQD
ncbi:MAG: ATP-grasp domain-containing protein [Alphaproteobacteria bacterium]|nr:ATP-grasp domain-containing protein [Alphaproteobacteria bacterium]